MTYTEATRQFYELPADIRARAEELVAPTMSRMETLAIVGKLVNALTVAKEHAEFEDEVLDLIDDAIAPPDGAIGNRG
ncbi:MULTISPECIES: hypothetical protein [Sinorhizobium]|uniref:hypothetical protein n=1 Tax=Sinorhizobium TaxID=28105 RepID=UPI000BE80711|nr:MULTISPECIES: hypothetical protein [Sinorhizobium]PDT55076.1 hypothetical protein CO664_08405 [Sinorhizobium sp. NG07B]POH32119.1 hypothetical protein ATY30_12025 [Sinorhizobium americanum]